ncbi:MAG: phage tail protein [Saprospiraceae bacterium]|nr:phage tail protein [Saprospiraceae bacterium]
MGQPYVGEIRMFAGNFAPNGWLFCDGQTLPISENEVLFQLIGTTYGGDGEETFNLPNLQSRIPLHMGTGPDGTTYQLGEQAGTEDVTLTVQQIPAHNHAWLGNANNGGGTSPAGSYLARNASSEFYTSDTSGGLEALNANSVSATGGSQPHTNVQPFLCINFIISLFGVFPSPT